MSRAKSLFSNWSGVFLNKSKRIFLDCGSSATRVIVNDQLVFNEPTCISMHENGEVVAIGIKARASWKRTPRNISTYFPINQGLISNQEVFEKFLKAVLMKIGSQKIGSIADLNWGITSYSGYCAIGSGFSPLERNVLADSLNKLAIGKLRLVDKSQAVAQHLSKQSKTNNFCFLDFGSQTTELGIVVDGNVVSSQTFQWGGDNLTQRVRQIVLAKNNFEISWEVAEIIKSQIGYVFVDDKRDQKLKEKSLKIRGKNISNNTIGITTVVASDFASDFLDECNIFLDELRITFDKTSVEILAKSLEGGLFMLGGASQLNDLDAVLAGDFSCSISKLKNPDHFLVKSLAEY